MKTELTQIQEPTNINELSKRKNEEIDKLLADIEASKTKIADIMGSQKQKNGLRKFTDQELDEIDYPLEDEELTQLSFSQIIKKLELVRESNFSISANGFLQGSRLYYIIEALNYIMSKMDRSEEFETNSREIRIVPFDELQDLTGFLRELRFDYDYFVQDTLNAIKRKIELEARQNAS